MKKIPAQPAYEKKEKKPLSTLSKVMLILIGILSLVMITITFIDMAGYHLIVPEINPIGCIAMILLLLIWGAILLYQRIRSSWVKKVAIAAFALLIMMLSTFALTLTTQYTAILLPHKFGTIVSPAGQKVVIMNTMDTGIGSDEEFAAMQARMDARMEALNAAAPEDTAETTEVTEGYPYSAYGYVYSAFPSQLGIFYRTDVDVEGLIYRGSESQAKLLYEWLDDTTVRFYLENPEPGDSGEVTLRLK